MPLFATKRASHNHPLLVGWQERIDRWQDEARAAVGPEAYEKLWEEGSALPMDQAVAYALDRSAT